MNNASALCVDGAMELTGLVTSSWCPAMTGNSTAQENFCNRGGCLLVPDMILTDVNNSLVFLSDLNDCNALQWYYTSAHLQKFFSQGKDGSSQQVLHNNINWDGHYDHYYGLNSSWQATFASFIGEGVLDCA